jgi:hypothetical protein
MLQRKPCNTIRYVLTGIEAEVQEPGGTTADVEPGYTISGMLSERSDYLSWQL